MEEPDTSITRPLEDGRVPCPVHRELIPLERCLVCGHLLTAERKIDGSLGEVTCDPPIGSLIAPLARDV